MLFRVNNSVRPWAVSLRLAVLRMGWGVVSAGNVARSQGRCRMVHNPMPCRSGLHIVHISPEPRYMRRADRSALPKTLHHRGSSLLGNADKCPYMCRPPRCRSQTILKECVYIGDVVAHD